MTIDTERLRELTGTSPSPAPAGWMWGGYVTGCRWGGVMAQRCRTGICGGKCQRRPKIDQLSALGSRAAHWAVFSCRRQ